MRVPLLLAIAMVVLLGGLAAQARAGEAAVEVRLGASLFDDIEALAIQLLPNITAQLLPLPLPGKNISVPNVQVYNVSLVDLEIHELEISIDTAAPGLIVAMYGWIRSFSLGTRSRCSCMPFRKNVVLKINYTLSYDIILFGKKTLPDLQATTNDAQLGITFTLEAPVPRLSIYTNSEYSYLDAGHLDLGIKDGYACIAAPFTPLCQGPLCGELTAVLPLAVCCPLFSQCWSCSSMTR